MFHYEDSSTGEQASVAVIAITGTHSTGKTTLVESFYDPEYSAEQLFEGVNLHTLHQSDTYYNLGAGRLTPRDESDEFIPMVICSEIATAYARKAHNPRILTDRYSFDHQIVMEAAGVTTAVDAMVLAGELAVKRASTGGIATGVVILDRTPLDGQVYRQARVPHEDQELVDLSRVERETIGHYTTYNEHARTWPISQWFRQFVRNYVDMVAVCEPASIPFEQNGLRIADTQFREDIAKSIRITYGELLPDRPMVSLLGDESTRRTQLLESLRELPLIADAIA